MGKVVYKLNLRNRVALCHLHSAVTLTQKSAKKVWIRLDKAVKILLMQSLIDRCQTTIMLDNASWIGVSGHFIYVLYTLPATPTFILCLHAMDGLDTDKDCKNLGKLYIWQGGTMMTYCRLYLVHTFIIHCTFYTVHISYKGYITFLYFV